ncbi:unnamed protein product [Knipowitschia caucasica]
MTKTGKPESYWRDICAKYAQGLYHFSTGKRPGAKKWKKALERIDACPLQSNTKDLFGRSFQCTCGFHKPAHLSSGTGFSAAGSSGAAASSGPAASSAAGSSRAGTSAAAGSTGAAASSGAAASIRVSTEEEGVRGDTEAGASAAAPGGQCFQCKQLVDGEHFSQHLLDHHTEETCDSCGAKVQGAVGLLTHIQQAHYAALMKPSPQKPTVLPPTPAPTPSPTPSPAPSPAPSPLPSCSSAMPPHTPFKAPSINWKGFLPEPFRRVIQEADQVWIAKCLYGPTGQLKQKLQTISS